MFDDMALHTCLCAFGSPAILASIESVVTFSEACQLLVLQARNTVNFRLVLFPVLPAISASIESVAPFVFKVEACQLLVLQALNTVNFRLVLFPVLPAISASIESVVRLVSIVEACQLLVLQALNTVLCHRVFFLDLLLFWGALGTWNERYGSKN
jgi:hypothetical protein